MRVGLHRNYKTDKYYTDEELKRCGIYKITCISNNKIYIGQTKSIGGFNFRWMSHLSSLKSNKCRNDYFKKMYNKYGIESFIFSIIEYIDIKDKDKMNVREQYWIKFYKSNQRDYGWNITDGGDGGNGLLGDKSSNAVLTNDQVALIKPRLLNGESPTKIAKEYNVGKSVITSIKVCKTYPNVREDLNDQLRNSIIYDRQGEIAPSAKLTNEMVKQIKYMLVNGESVEDISKKINVNEDTVDNIRSVKNWRCVASELNDILESMINHRIAFTEEQLKEIRILYSTGKYSQKRIGKMYGVTQSCIDDIVNYSERYILKENEEYIPPIKKKIEFTHEQIREIRLKFSKGGITKVDLAKEYTCSDATINNIVYYKGKYKLKDGEEYIEPSVPEMQKPSSETVKEIRMRYQDEDDLRIEDLAKIYNLSSTTIGDIVNYRKAYKLKDREIMIENNKKASKPELTIEDIINIRNKFKSKLATRKKLAEEYNVSEPTIKRIIYKKEKYANI